MKKLLFLFFWLTPFCWGQDSGEKLLVHKENLSCFAYQPGNDQVTNELSIHSVDWEIYEIQNTANGPIVETPWGDCSLKNRALAACCEALDLVSIPAPIERGLIVPHPRENTLRPKLPTSIPHQETLLHSYYAQFFQHTALIALVSLLCFSLFQFFKAKKIKQTKKWLALHLPFWVLVLLNFLTTIFCAVQFLEKYSSGPDFVTALLFYFLTLIGAVILALILSYYLSLLWRFTKTQSLLSVLQILTFLPAVFLGFLAIELKKENEFFALQKLSTTRHTPKTIHAKAGSFPDFLSINFTEDFVEVINHSPQTLGIKIKAGNLQDGCPLKVLLALKSEEHFIASGEKASFALGDCPPELRALEKLRFFIDAGGDSLFMADL